MANGGYALQWRTGRQALGGTAKQGEIVGSIFIESPINGLLSVDRQFPLPACCSIPRTACTWRACSHNGQPRKSASSALPGEFFQGIVYRGSRNDGGIYFGAGKATPLIFKSQGWSLDAESGPAR